MEEIKIIIFSEMIKKLSTSSLINIDSEVLFALIGYFFKTREDVEILNKLIRIAD